LKSGGDFKDIILLPELPIPMYGLPKPHYQKIQLSYIHSVN